MKAVFIGVLAVTFLIAGRPQAQTKADEGGDTVVAIVNGEKVRRSEVFIFYQGLPEQYRQQPIGMLFTQIVAAIIDRRIVAQEAIKQGMRKDKEVVRQLAILEQGILQEKYLRKAIDAELTEKKLRQIYDQTIGKQVPPEEVHARHILLEAEDTAKKLIAEIAAGADFVELAKKNSTGPSASRGGDLGFFAREAMVPAFAEAAFAMKPGESSKTPVKTRFGWHIIKVEGRQPGKNPSFEESVQGIRNAEVQKVTMAILDKLRGQARIERFNPDGTPIKDDGKKKE